MNMAFQSEAAQKRETVLFGLASRSPLNGSSRKEKFDN